MPCLHKLWSHLTFLLVSSIAYAQPAATYVDLIEILIDGGAYIDVKDSSGNTPIYHAMLNNNTEAVAKFIEKGADLHRLYKAFTGERFVSLLEVAEGISKQFPEKDFTKIINLIKSAYKEQ